MVAFSKSSFFFGNQPTPKIITGAVYPPSSYGFCVSAVTTTINRCYYFPWHIDQAHSYPSVICKNNGAGDNGEKVRIMFFKDDAAAGGPGTLAKDFGEITLTGAAAYRTLTPATPWAATPGMYWGAFWCETAADWYGMQPVQLQTAAGYSMGPHMTNMIGVISTAPDFLVRLGHVAHGHYVDTAYGAAPATAVAPTASLVGAPGTAPLLPGFVLVG